MANHWHKWEIIKDPIWNLVVPHKLWVTYEMKHPQFQHIVVYHLNNFEPFMCKAFYTRVIQHINNIVWSTVSNALDRSMNTSTVVLFYLVHQLAIFTVCAIFTGEMCMTVASNFRMSPDHMSIGRWTVEKQVPSSSDW